ncbi:hypothetical protein SCALM49S_03355 [Streptomyces californicus]
MLEALPAGTGAVVYAEVADAAEERELPAPPGGAEVRWVHRDRGGSLVAAVRGAGADLDGVERRVGGGRGVRRAGAPPPPGRGP